MTIRTETRNGRKLFIVEIGAKCYGYLSVEKALEAIARILKGGQPDGGEAATYSIAGWEL